MNARGSVGRQALLLAVAFLATSVLLVGAWALVQSAGKHPPLAAASGAPPRGSASPGTGPSSSGLIQPPTFAPGSSGTPPTIVITGAGDIGDCAASGARETSDILLREQGWFFTAGDNAYENGTAAEFAACYAPTWGRVFDRTILPAAGNHDWNTDGAAGYLGYFGMTAAPQGMTWYSRELGAWHVIVLDSNCAKVGGCDANSPQGKWLAHDLAVSTAHCTLAIWHHPRFSSGDHGNDPEVGPFWDQLYAANAELVVNGHDHDYERFAPQDPSGREQRPRGLREIVAGTGGGVLRQFKATVPNSEFRHASVWGVLRLTLHPTRFDWEFLPTDGLIADSGTSPCH